MGKPISFLNIYIRHKCTAKLAICCS